MKEGSIIIDTDLNPKEWSRAWSWKEECQQLSCLFWSCLVWLQHCVTCQTIIHFRYLSEKSSYETSWRWSSGRAVRPSYWFASCGPKANWCFELHFQEKELRPDIVMSRHARKDTAHAPTFLLFCHIMSPTDCVQKGSLSSRRISKPETSSGLDILRLKKKIKKVKKPTTLFCVLRMLNQLETLPIWLIK